MTTTIDPFDPRRAWLSSLVQELYHAERAACEGPRIEAERLGDVPAAQVLRAVVDHATAAVAEFPPLLKRYDPMTHEGGGAVETTVSVLSAVRDFFVADAPSNSERSYRQTLLRLR